MNVRDQKMVEDDKPRRIKTSSWGYRLNVWPLIAATARVARADVRMLTLHSTLMHASMFEHSKCAFRTTNLHTGSRVRGDGRVA
jgi:hypothetical protein